MNTAKRKIISVMCAAASLSLAACSSAPTEYLDPELPWHDGDSSYEKLDYAVTVYDTSKGSAEGKRVPIALGEYSLELTENVRTEGSTGYSALEMSFYVEYNSDAPEKDRGKRDEIKSSTEFQTASLMTSKMEKTLTLADRAGTVNDSYTVTADYFGTHKATRTFRGETKEMTIPSSTYHDNEMMFYIARATGLINNGTTNFSMTNVFESFQRGSFSSFTMNATCGKDYTTLTMGDWFKPYVVYKDDEQKPDPSAPCEIKCFSAGIVMNVPEHGPPYYVYYTERDIKDGEKTHKKLPVRITYSEYTGSKQVKTTEYILKGLSFNK